MAEAELKARALHQFRSELSSLLRRHDDALDSVPGWSTLLCMACLYVDMSRGDLLSLQHIDRVAEPVVRAAYARLRAEGETDVKTL